MIASLTLVAPVGDAIPTVAALHGVAEALAPLVRDLDTVLVANGIAAAAALGLKALVELSPDTTAIFLASPVHPDVARLVGIEHAVGDLVLLFDPAVDDPAVLPALLAPVAEGYDLVVAAPPAPVRSRPMLGLYARAYRAITGLPLSLAPTGVRVISRAAALHVAGRPDAELMLRAHAMGAAFPALVLDLPASPAALSPADRVPRHDWPKAVSLLLSASTLPLRGASYAALTGGVVSVLYSVYVFAVFLLKRDVAAGWTTLSLQLAGMMFVFSVVLLLLSEYVLQIHAASPPRNRRYLVVRELRSPLSRRTARLNVVDADGRFQLGKPEWLGPR